jgi:hypothetical protein
MAEPTSEARVALYILAAAIVGGIVMAVVSNFAR